MHNPPGTWKVLGLLSFAVISVAAAPAVNSALAQSPPPTAEPRSPYVEHGCYQCHGYNGQGGVATGPALVPRGGDFKNFAAYVRQPAGVMPPYSANILSDADLQEIWEYVSSLPPSPQASDMELLAR